MKVPRFWRGITAQIFSALVGVSIICIGVSVLTLTFQSRSALRNAIGERNREMALQASREISRYVSDSIDELGALGKIIGPLPSDPWIQHAVLANLTLEFTKFRQIAILGSDGAIITHSWLEESNGGVFDKANLTPILTDQTKTSPVRIADDFTPYMLVATPTRTMRGTKGWLVAELHLRSIWDLVDQITIGGAKVAYLVSTEGKLIAHPDKIRVLAPDASNQVPAPPRTVPANGTVRVEKVKGVDRYLTAYASVNGIDWIVAVQQPIQDAFLPASMLFRSALMLAILGIGLSLVLSLFVSNALSSPFVHLLEGTKIIGAGDLDHRINIRGAEEVKRLADSFNSMVDSLRARTAELAESERQYRLMAEQVNDIIFTLDEQGRVTYLSPRLQAMVGFVPADYIGKDLVERLPANDRTRARSLLRDLLESSGRIDREMQTEIATRDGKKILMEAHITAETNSDGKREIYGVARDVSERAKLIEQLNQAQKMEAVGRLAGGVAHDFNNLLTAIIGYCDFSLQQLDDQDGLRRNLEEIRKAGTRAAGLTQQLLAFSRRQVMQPKIIDLNHLILNMEKMLHRLLGEDVKIDTRLAPELDCMLADPGQIEQVIMNLCINSRDALPRGGRISIETGNVSIESTRSQDKFTVAKGNYVRLRIADNGIGMDQATRAHLFEPFFTTKEVGKGTGLGLSTVYGIVKQTGGYIWIESEPGMGTIIDILFPRTESKTEASEASTAPIMVRGGGESILLVEDERMIRELVRNVLDSHGYTVLEAYDGQRAEDIFRSRGQNIDLVISDVVLPGISGRELVERLTAARSGIPALFMSGYTQEVMDSHGVLRSGVAFLQKPFTAESLLLKVREVLDARRRA